MLRISQGFFEVMLPRERNNAEDEFVLAGLRLLHELVRLWVVQLHQAAAEAV